MDDQQSETQSVSLSDPPIQDTSVVLQVLQQSPDLRIPQPQGLPDIAQEQRVPYIVSKSPDAKSVYANLRLNSDFRNGMTWTANEVRRRITMEFSGAAVDAMRYEVSLLNDLTADKRLRLDAAEAILDRITGKARQADERGDQAAPVSFVVNVVTSQAPGEGKPRLIDAQVIEQKD